MRGIVLADRPSRDHLLPCGALGSYTMGMRTGLSAYDSLTAQFSVPYPAVPVFAPLSMRILPFGRRIRLPIERPSGSGSSSTYEADWSGVRRTHEVDALYCAMSQLVFHLLSHAGSAHLILNGRGAGRMHLLVRLYVGTTAEQDRGRVVVVRGQG